VPPKPRELTEEEIRKLEDQFRATLFRELGRVPKDAMAEFRAELDAVRTLPYEEAKRVIDKLARDIIKRFIKPPPVAPPRVVPYRPPPIPPGVPYGVVVPSGLRMKGEIMKRLRSGMSAKEVIEAVKAVYGWSFDEKAAASYYRARCIEMGWAVPEWVKKALGMI